MEKMFTTVIFRLTTIFILFTFFFQGCKNEAPREKGAVTITFKHGKILQNPDYFAEIIEEFERENPDIKVKDEVLPSSTDEQHQFYVINLGGGTTDIDVISMDVIWVPEFAMAGWLRDLSDILPRKSRENYFRASVLAATYRDKLYAIPWYIDAGILYYRKDLLKRYGYTPPKTWDELVSIAKDVTQHETGMYGFIWQGKQYEGLVCNTLEYMWGNGGGVIKGGKIVVDSTENIYALTFMRDLIYKYRVTPEFVTTSTEEPSRRIFGNGKAVFMRNWPYAFNIFQREDSVVKGKVGIYRLPSFSGRPHASTLGGWQLGINRYSRHPKEAERFLKFLTSYRTQKLLTLSVGYRPALKGPYSDKELTDVQPFLKDLYSIFEEARPRPVTPAYMMLSQVLQSEFSAVISGIKEPANGLRSAQRKIEAILKR